MKKISRDLEEISKLVMDYKKKQGFNHDEAMREALEIVKLIGNNFNGDNIYISINNDILSKVQRIKEQWRKGVRSPTEIAKITGIPRQTVSFHLKKM